MCCVPDRGINVLSSELDFRRQWDQCVEQCLGFACRQWDQCVEQCLGFAGRQ